MASENKTRPTDVRPADHVAAIDDPRRRADAEALLALFTEWTGETPRMWGPSLIGFGEYHYRYDSGREGDMFRVGFSPRKRQLVLYILPGLDGFEGLLARLGKHKTGKSCLYVNKLADLDLGVLRELVVAGLANLAEKYPGA